MTNRTSSSGTFHESTINPFFFFDDSTEVQQINKSQNTTTRKKKKKKRRREAFFTPHQWGEKCRASKAIYFFNSINTYNNTIPSDPLLMNLCNFHLVLLLLLLLVLCCCYDASATSNGVDGISCPVVEKTALLQFKAKLDDPSGILSSWVSSADCCRWKGVTCDNQTGSVISVDLRNKNATDLTNVDYDFALSGEIDPSLTSLRSLQHLDLSANDFFDSDFPNFVGSLKELRYLNLSATGLLGSVPSGYGNLSKLRYLDFSYNTGVSLLPEKGFFGRLTSLEYIDMTGVNLSAATDLFQSLNLLPSLSVIKLVQCSIQSIPPSLPHLNFTSLVTLDLSRNQMIDSGLPEWLFQLRNLEHLGLGNTISDVFLSSDGNIGGIPDGIGSLGRLRFLDLSSNILGGSIPESLIGNLSFLEEIHLEDNNLTGSIPKSLGRSRLGKTLRLLNLANNVLTGSISDESIAGLSSLQYLDLSYNNLTGSIPDVLGTLSSLQYLNLRNNMLTDSIPPSIGNLTSLQTLDLSNNDLGDIIPPSLCGGSFTTLDLSWNMKMKGTIPDCIWENGEVKILGLSGSGLEGVLLESHFSKLGRLDQLTITGSRSVVFNMSEDWIPPFSLSLLYLYSCKIGPRFPMWLKTQDSIIGLSMTLAELEGNLPSWIWNFSSQITIIDLSSNQMSGKFPAAVSSNIVDISMGFNNFEGEDWFSGLWKMMPLLQFLSLTTNNLNGTIPPSLCRSGSLEGLDLSGNNFSGRIPGCLVGSVQNYLNLGNNNLDGPFPSSNATCNLKSLHLDRNRLSGTIPTSFGSCRNIIILDLGQNMFRGSIPAWFGSSLSSLKILLLHSNLFSGAIPPELASLTSLQVMDLSHNNLSGKIPASFGNFSAMIHMHMKDESMGDYYNENISVVTKGSSKWYTTTLSLVTSIDLSSNGLTGDVPEELGDLLSLVNLNLSKNRLTGGIPSNISRLRQLETLDLSTNLLSGGIPPVMSTMTSLNHLNLSFNNLSGSIPTGNQFHTFDDSSIFMGNPYLCGFPLKNTCDDDDDGIRVREENADDGIKEEVLVMYLSTVVGIIVGFWAFYGTLLFNRSWRNSYVQSLEDMNLSVYLTCNRQIKRFFR